MVVLEVVEKLEGFLRGTQLAGDFEKRMRGGGEQEVVEVGVGRPVIRAGGLKEGDYLGKNGFSAFVVFRKLQRWCWWWRILEFGGEMAASGGGGGGRGFRRF